MKDVAVKEKGTIDFAELKKESINQSDEYALFEESVESFGLLNGIDKILFLFSGGKDATFGLTMLTKYLKAHDLNIDLNILMITYPLHVYFHKNGIRRDIYQDTLDYWKTKNVHLSAIEPEEEDLPNFNTSGCHICKRVRMEAVTKFISKHIAVSENTAIVTGYTLYDAHAYMQEFSTTTNYTYDVNVIKNPKMKNKMLNYLHKMQIKENLSNGMQIIRPLLQFKEDVIRAYLAERNIPFINVPCKVADYKPKRQMFKLLNEMSGDLNITYGGLMNFLDSKGVVFPKNFNDISSKFDFTDC
ncbi:MAG: hypothetical protein GY729_16215 [Desulfobacteraceae bacterium]|nr:hypothetical protein [Desulfobacteraceae bacterium]